MRLDHASVRALLPHRHPMILIDRVEHVEPGARLEAIKVISGSEPCYHGDPADCAYPASLLIESFGQAAAVLWLLSGEGRQGLPMFAAARDVVMGRRVEPGDVVRHLVRLDQTVDGAAFASGESLVGTERVAGFASMMAVIRPRTALNGNQETGRHD